MADKKDDIVLSIRGMSKSFGRNRVLDHINLDPFRFSISFLNSADWRLFLPSNF